MRKLRPTAIFLTFFLLPTYGVSDGGLAGVNDGLQDAPVVPVIREGAEIGAPLVAGSNTTGRPGVGPDQVYGYDVDIAYDHVAVGFAILAGLFLMTEWMERR